jgi:hypothetical protein
MGFMSITGDSSSATIHAKHTIDGRRILSSNDELYEVTQFAFADDEINYQFMDADLSIDRSDDDLANWPILEPSSNSRNELTNKIWVNRVIGDNRFTKQIPETGKIVRVELTTGSQGILSSRDTQPMFRSAIQTIVTNSSTLQREIRVDSYEIMISNTGTNYVRSGKDFFDFFMFEMISPIETSTHIKRTNMNGGVKYVFNKIDSTGRLYSSNQLGVKIVELEVGIDAHSAQYKQWVDGWRTAQFGDLFYPNMVTIKSISTLINFDDYTLDTSVQSSSFDVYVKTN